QLRPDRPRGGARGPARRPGRRPLPPANDRQHACPRDRLRTARHRRALGGRPGAAVHGAGAGGGRALPRARGRRDRHRGARPRERQPRGLLLPAHRARERSDVRPGIATVYRWELRKLVSQKRTYIGVGAAAALPVLFVVVMALQKGGPYDAPLGHNLRKTGIALALVVLNFASRFGAQLVTALVAGDIVANEDSVGTLKMILTRSLRRGQILGGKILASFTYVC